MTAVAAIVQDGVVWIGGDSAFQAGLSRRDRPEPKVVPRGQWVFGVAGSPWQLQLVRYQFEPPEPGPARRMCTTCTAALRSCLDDGGWEPGKDNEPGGIGGIGGSVFRVGQDYQVAEEAPFTAIGCGRDLALGSLFTTQAETRTPEDRLTVALAATERFSTGLRSPWRILRTPDKAPNE